jgi:hypothetical protein
MAYGQKQFWPNRCVAFCHDTSKLDLLLQRSVSLNVVCRCGAGCHEYDRRKSARHHDSLFHPAGAADCRRSFRISRHGCLLRLVRWPDAVVPHGVYVESVAASRFCAAGCTDGVGNGGVAFSLERDLSSRALCGSFPHPVLALRVSRRLPELSGYDKMALGVRD